MNAHRVSMRKGPIEFPHFVAHIACFKLELRVARCLAELAHVQSNACIHA
jgi:hypothetical protein